MNGHDSTREQNMEARMTLAAAERSTFYERTVPKGKRRPMVENWMPELEGEH